MTSHLNGCPNFFVSVWETSARPLASESENLAGRVENRPGQVEFCIGYIKDYPVRASAKNFLVSQPVCLFFILFFSLVNC